MKILIVCSGNAFNFSFEKHQAFIYDQINSINRKYHDINFEKFFVTQKGIKGYWNHIKMLKQNLSKEKFDLIHAHNSVIGLLCIFQRKVSVIATFHGSDINFPRLNVISSLVSLFAKHIIFVSEKLQKKMYVKIRASKCSVIPCGVDLEIFKPQNKEQTQKAIILFASSFQLFIKNPELAKTSVSLIDIDIDLVELKNKSRVEVNALLNKADLLLLTSFSEGSPQIIKEAMACNCPIVSTDVGDVRELIGHTEGCYICSFDPNDVADKIKMALEFARTKGRTNGRQRIIKLGLDSESVAKKIIEVYQKVLKKN
jgi:teichuronic acid biosynthesis glycosyltransferase TuaC